MAASETAKTVVLRGSERSGGSAWSAPRGAALREGAEVGGRYRIERLLGSGGMARVWLAEDLEQRMHVAFKEMQVPALSSQAELDESALLFRREYFAMRKLQHPGTVKVFECGVLATGNRYLTMEVVNGHDLCELAARAPMPSAAVHRILTEMAQILAYVHSRLFVHCDIKAENVRLMESGRVKLMDFGIMHPLGTRASGKLWGTPAYMAPEWHEHGIIDGRTDLYSLGVLGFFLLTGTPPYDTAEVGAAMVAAVGRPALELSALAQVDPGLAKIEARASYLHLPMIVGRQRETEELAARLEAAKGRCSRALLIGAPAGVGKSRLVQELELDARNVDIPFALGACRAEGLAARAPIEQALRALAAVTPTEVLAPLRPVLGKLVPSLAVPEMARFRDAGEEKIAVFDALSRWLRELAEITPFVICLEDLHWADNATVEALNVVIRALHRSAGLVIGTFRSDEVSRVGLLFQTVDEGVADSLELAPLAQADLRALVELALQGFRLSEALATNLFAATRGNAFFATECMRALIEEGALQRHLGTWTAAPELSSRALPASIKEVVLARLSTLSPSLVAFLRRLAPAGRALDIPLIEALAEVAAHELFATLDEGVERQFLQYAEGRYYFTHATVHEAIYESTPEPMRRAFHGRIAEHLLTTRADDPEAARSIGYHFARSLEPTRAIAPLLRAGGRALDNKALLEAFSSLEEAAGLLEASAHVPDRDAQLIAAWGALIEVGYNSSTPDCIRYAQKLFQHWDASIELAKGEAEMRAELAAAHAEPAPGRRRRLGELFGERPLSAVHSALATFLKRAEYRILESIALAITGRTGEFMAGLARTDAEHPEESPYRAAAHVAIGGLTSHTGHFRGAVEEMRRHVASLRTFVSDVDGCPRRLQWSLGMGAYFMNMNLALMGRPLDVAATQDSFALAERLGFTDLRVYHLFSQIVRASLIGDGAAFTAPFTEMNELMRKLGNPRLPERNLTIYTPPYYLERGELELAHAVITKSERLVAILPGDRWLALYAVVYRACLGVAAATQQAEEARGAGTASGDPAVEAIRQRLGDAEVEAALARAAGAVRSADFRMETLLLIYQARWLRLRRRAAEAMAAARAALERATDPLRHNPFDEILARRELAELSEDGDAVAELERALALAEQSGNVLQGGIVSLALASRLAATAPARARAHQHAAITAFTAARAERWLRRAEAAAGPEPAG
jgi:eukaryotic-like serine/threonine-protein kinase